MTTDSNAAQGHQTHDRPGPPGGGQPRPSTPSAPPARAPARRPARQPAKAPPPNRQGGLPDPPPLHPHRFEAILDLREAEAPAPVLVGPAGASATEVAHASTTTDPRSSLPRHQVSETTSPSTTHRDEPGSERPPTVADEPRADSGGDPGLPSPHRTRGPLGWRASWPEIRFYLGAVALFFVSFALTTGLWVLGPVVVLGWEPVAITSGSMAPAIQVGDVVVFSEREASSVGPGTVIVFEDGGGGLTTHRVVETLEDGRYITRGDANDVPDSTPVEQQQVRGVGRVLVPFAGYPAVWSSGGRWYGVLLVAVLFGGLGYASRWAVLPKYSPWREESASTVPSPADPITDPPSPDDPGVRS